MEIRAFKLITGEEIVAGVESRQTLLEGADGGSVTVLLNKPHILRLQQVGPNQLGLAFVPWTLANPDLETVPLPVSAIVAEFAPSSNVEKQFIQQTSSIDLSAMKL